VNGNLRLLLESAVWRATESGDAEPVRQSEMVVPALCRVLTTGEALEVQGRLFTARNPTNPKLNRSVFIPDVIDRDAPVELRAARRDPKTGACVSEQTVITIPGFLRPDVVLDANLRHVMYTAVSNAQGAKTVALYEIDWELTDDEGGRLVRRIPRVVLTGAEAAEHVARAAGMTVGASPGVVALNTWRTPAGRVMSVDGELWRTFTPQAQRIPGGAGDSAEDGSAPLRPLKRSGADSDCAALGAKLQAQPGFNVSMYEGSGSRHCFAVKRGRPQDASPRTDQIVVAVYARPTRAGLERGTDSPPAPIASLPRFGRVAPGAELSWHVGNDAGDYAGWIAALGPDNDGKPRYVAAPWSTCALWRIGIKVLAQQPQKGDAKPPPPQAGVCEGR
jgi:hypothetical protein